MAEQDKANITSNLTADTANKAAVSKPQQNKKLQTKKVNDVISRGRAMTGSPADQIIVNPVMEESEKTAVMTFGRFNPPTVGHEKLIHKVESVAKQHNGTAHIVASHSEGNAKNPLPADKKVGYIKKVASQGTKVSSSSGEAPTLLHQAAKLHSQGHQHLVMVAGQDRVKEYHTLLHKYNNVSSKHGHYNFKSIKVVSAGQRDPDAEGTEGMSGTKMRAHARAGEMKQFKSGLPKALHPHAEEIANHIRSVKEDLYTEIFTALIEDQVRISDSSWESLVNKSIKSSVTIDEIESVYNEAYIDYLISPKSHLTAEQYSFNAVNSFIANKKFTEEYNTPVAKKDFGKTKHFQALDDLDLNTANRNHTIKEYSYGPLNPNAENEKFWQDKADLWNTSVEEARRARCGNCAAFNQSEAVLKKINAGLGPEGEKVSKLANLGFCEIFEFKCAGNRTCDAWLVGGPLKEEKIKKKKEFVPAAPSYSWVSETNRSDTSKREWGTTSLTRIYKKDTPGEKGKSDVVEDINSVFEAEFKATDREAIARSGQDRKKLDYVLRLSKDRKNDTGMYRQQAITKRIFDLDEATRTSNIKGWSSAAKDLSKLRSDKFKESMPAKLVSVNKDGSERKTTDASTPFTSEKLARDHHERMVKLNPGRKIRHNLYVDGKHITTLGEEFIEEDFGCPIDEDLELHELIEEDFIVTGDELYEDWGEPLEEAEKGGRKVKLGTPFLTPGGPKKRAVYVKHPQTGNVVKVNFGDPNMTIKKSDPARRRSFRARHNCDNPGPRHKARYWSCRAW